MLDPSDLARRSAVNDLDMVGHAAHQQHFVLKVCEAEVLRVVSHHPVFRDEHLCPEHHIVWKRISATVAFQPLDKSTAVVVFHLADRRPLCLMHPDGRYEAAGFSGVTGVGDFAPYPPVQFFRVDLLFTPGRVDSQSQVNGSHSQSHLSAYLRPLCRST